MTHTFGRVLAGVACSCLIAGAATANAAEIKTKAYFGWAGVGPTNIIEEGHFYWVGEFTGARMDIGAATALNNSSLRCPGWLDINIKANTRAAAGYCTSKAVNGDTFVSAWHCEGKADPGDCIGENKIISGTGMFASVSGIEKITGITANIWPNGNSSGYTMLEDDLTTK